MAVEQAQSHLQDLHRRVTGQIIEDRTREMDGMRAARREAAKRAEQRASSGMETLKLLGLDTAKLQEINRERNQDAEQRYRSAEARMNKLSQEPSNGRIDLHVESAMTPQGAHALQPVWTAGFSTVDEEDTLIAASDLKARDLLTGGATQDYWNWASGGGWGCLGSGVGEIQSWVYFGFWFLPNQNRFWSVLPLFRFRGYYIVQADDGFFDCKSAGVRVSAWTNVYQYNWKGWNHVDVLDVSGDNINRNERFDADRYPYSSYLLGGGDWAWISCVVGLYARAQGGGSYSKNDYAEGAANYLSVPQCYVY
jgi:hypothetical protein